MNIKKMQPKIAIALAYTDGKISQIKVTGKTKEAKDFLQEFWHDEDGDMGLFGEDTNSLVITTYQGKIFTRKVLPGTRKKVEEFFGGISFMEAVTKNVQYTFLEENSHDFSITKRQ